MEIKFVHKTKIKLTSYYYNEFCLSKTEVDVHGVGFSLHLFPNVRLEQHLVIFVYLSSLPVAHLSDAPRRRLIVTGGSARIQDEATERSAWFFNVLGVYHRHTRPRFKVSSEMQSVTVRLTSPGIEPTNSSFQVELSNQLSYAGLWLVG